MRKIIPLLIVFLMIPIMAMAEDYGFFDSDMGEIWYVTGTVDMDIYHHDGRDEMIEYHYVKLSPEAYDFVYWLSDGIESPPGKEDAACEVMIYTLDENYNLDDYIGDEITFTGFPFEASTIYHRRHIVVELTAVLYASSGRSTPKPVSVDYLDYLEIVGLSPEIIRAMYGEPDQQVEEVVWDTDYLTYNYYDVSVVFIKNPSDKWEVCSAAVYVPDSPVRMGDVFVGMTQENAQKALFRNGYYYEMTDASNRNYFIGEIKPGGMNLVLLRFENGVVVTMSGWFGITAENAIETNRVSKAAGKSAANEQIDTIVLTISPSFGVEGEMVDTVMTIHPDAALTALVYEHDFFNMPEYLDTGVLDGDFVWITVNLLNGGSKTVGGLVADEFGPDDFIAIYNAVVQALETIE